VKPTSPICRIPTVWLIAVALISSAHAAEPRLSIRAATVNPPVRTIPHIANGEGWRTTVILVNTGAEAASFELKFWGDNGQPLVLDLGPDGKTADLSGVIQPGVARFIRSVSSGAVLQSGWAELTAPKTVDGNAIFGLQSPGQGDSEAAVPLGPTGGNDLYIPFDYSPGYSTGIAFANPVQLAATVSAVIEDDSGTAIPAGQTVTVPAHGHYSNVLALPFPAVQQKRGVAHFSSINLYGMGIRANGKAFTSIEALAGVPSGSKTIPHVADGGGWRMTFLLVNTDTHAASFTLSFRSDSGSPLVLPLGADGSTSSLTGTIQPGDIRIIKSTGTAAKLATGWGSLSVTGAIGGTAIFAHETPGQPDSEAAVPFTRAANKHLYVPYDYTPGYSTGIALTNPDPNNTATVMVSLLDDKGHAPANPTMVYNVPPNGHKSLVLGELFPTIAGTRGSVSLTSDVPLFGLGIRANGLAFTSLKVIPAAMEITITNGAALSIGCVAVGYHFGFLASGGVPPYIWTMVSGSIAPGLTLTADGMIGGIPAGYGTFNFRVQVADTEGNSTQVDFIMQINPDELRPH
jgi:hypothetical protein